MHTARPISSPHRHLRRAIPANPYPIPPMPRPAPLMPPAAFPALPTPFACPAEKKWSRHDPANAPHTSRRTCHTPGDNPMTYCIPLALIIPAAPPAASIRDTGQAALTRPGWAEPGQDHSGLWLRNAAAGLCVLAAAAAAVSFTAQYRMVDATRHLAVIAALEAAIPDAAALVFACLGVALALHGRRALRARTLNLAAVTASVFMNIIAAGPGWRNLAIWAMPPIAYALASDTLIGVVRGWALARHQHLDTPLAADAATPLSVLGGLILWLLRLTMAPASTLAGFRAWVLEECPVAPGRHAPRPAPPPTRAHPGRGRRTDPGKATKTARFLDLVTERHGPLASIPLDATARIASALAPQADLNPGAARTALRKAVLAAQNGDLR